jgi:hypothetical protein
MAGSVKRDGDDAVIRLPMAEIHALRVALRCPCGVTRSAGSKALVDGLDKALARLEAQT